MPKKVYKLTVNDTSEFLVAGVVCSSRDFKLCFELNRAFAFNFVRLPDITLSARPGSTTKHSYYASQGSEQELYHILSNRDNNRTGLFIPEYREFDYFFLVSGYASGFSFPDLVARLKEVPLIAAIYVLNPDEMKSSDAFRLFIEE